MQVIKFSLVVLLCMAIFAPPAEATSAITCNQVANSLFPCVAYLQGRSPLPQACCVGVRGLANSVRTQADRRTTCNCMKAAARSLGINYGNAAAIPRSCGVRISFNISPTTDCSRIG